MIVFPPVKFSLDTLLGRSVFYAAVISSFSVLVLLVLLFTYPWKSSVDVSRGQEAFLQTNKRSFPYEMIGSGPLELKASHALGWVARIADELSLIAYNSRPDSDLKQTQILLRLKNGKEQLTLVNGKSFYLKESETGKGLSSSSELTGLWVKPIILDGGSVLLEVGRKFISKEGEEGEERGQFIASLQGMGASQLSASQTPLSEIKLAQFFSQDVFMQRYAGKEYGYLNQKGVIDITGAFGTYALLVSTGDYLLYKDKEWHVVGSEELETDAPIGYVRSVSEKGVDVEVWDAKGFAPVQFKLETTSFKQPSFGSESMPSSIRLRTGTQVSCAMGKRRLILKQGDWLLKTASGWRSLRNSEDVQLYLERRLKGDLFVFDAIEKDPQGKFLMKGHLFNDSRSYMQPISLPINIDKQQNKTSRKRRSAALNGNRGIK